MKKVLVIHLGQGRATEVVSFLGQEVQVQRVGNGGDAELTRNLIAAQDGQVDAIGLEGMPAVLQLGPVSEQHTVGASLAAAASHTSLVDGSGIRPVLERWGVILADRAEPGIFSHKRILLVPGLNHAGLAQALRRHSPSIRYADPVIYFALPDFPGVGSRMTLEQAAPLTLEQLKGAPFRRIQPQPGSPGKPRARAPFDWAEVLAGDIGAIRRYAPPRLDGKIVIVPSACEADLDDLQARGVSIAVVLIQPAYNAPTEIAWSEAGVEALFAALRPQPDLPLTENTYLDMIGDLAWQPEIRYLQPGEAGVNRFAFVIHPLDVGFIHQHPWFRWTKYFPDGLVEAVGAYFPPIYLSRITGGRSPTTGQRVEGYLISLGATPRQMMKHDEHFTYLRLHQAAKMAERKGARIMGLGAFTRVVGDAGVTVAHEADIAITSGNSLTVAVTLEAAKRAVRLMGASDLRGCKAMVIGATGSIGSVCARLLAKEIDNMVLVSIEPERLLDLKRTLQVETPAARVTIATRSDDYLGECDLIVSATSAFGQRVLDITRCKPGAVVCDVARPPDVNAAEAALRPDVLVIESGEVLIPGEIDFGYDIGLPPKTAYACLAETALLAMEGRFEDYTLGRNLEIERIQEIYRLFQKHGFQLAGLRSFDQYIRPEVITCKRQLAERLRQDPALFEHTRSEAARQLVQMPVMSKGVGASDRTGRSWWWAAVGLGMLTFFALWQRRRSQPGRVPWEGKT